VLVLAIAAPAVAEEARVRFDADDAVCDPEPVRSRVRVLLGHDPFAASATTTVRLAVTRTAGEVRATLVVVDGDGLERGQRALAVASCGELADAAALVIAMIVRRIEPSGVEPVAEERAEPAIVEEPVPPLAPAAVVPMRRVGRERGDAALVLGVAGGAGGGGLAGAGMLGARFRSGAVSIALELQVTAPASVAVGPGRVAVTSGTIELAPCAHRGELAACVGLAGGWVTGRGEDLTNPRSATTPYAAAGARVAWERAISAQVGLRLHVAVRAPLTRNRFLVDEMAVWENGALESWVGASLVARIP
jgi:hypothetical protein